MLPDIRLDEENFDEILDWGRKRITSIFPPWTDFNAHDPGITLLELFAAMKEVQQFYADRIGGENREKYVKLLGIRRRKKQAAHSYVHVKAKGNYRLLSGHKMDAGTLCFETAKCKQLVKGDIYACFAVCGGLPQEYMDRERLLFGSLLHIPVFGSQPISGSMFCLCFDQALPQQNWLDLYIEVYEESGMQRNPPGDGDFQNLVQLEWQYYSGKEWKKIEYLRDETNGFLFGGFIRFSLPEAMEKHAFMGHDGYFIRVLLKEGEYDRPPVLTGVSMNICEAVQKETQVECLRMPGGKARMLLDTELAALGSSEVYVGTGEFWYPVSGFQKEICSETGKVGLTVYDGRVMQAEGIMVINRDETGTFKRMIGMGNGFPYQEIDLSDLQVLYESFEILVQDGGRERYRLWKKVDNFSASARDDCHYIFDSMQGLLYFGDSIHGMAPEGRMILAGYARTMGSDGNIQRGSINRFRMEGLEGAPVTNICGGFGGCEEETQEECFVRARQFIKENQCAVTKQDFERFARETPGLLIESCKVLPVDEIRQFIKHAGETTIYLVVKPYGEKLGSLAEQGYAQNIERHLEKYRLIGNPVCVLFPEYVEMDVYVDAVVKTQYLHVEEQVRKAIREFFGRYRKAFGGVVAHSGLYGFLEKQDFVLEVRSLHIDARGNGAKTGEEGNILLSPYATPVLKEIKTFLVLS